MPDYLPLVFFYTFCIVYSLSISSYSQSQLLLIYSYYIFSINQEVDKELTLYSDSILYYFYALIWYIILINIYINFISNHLSLSYMSYISLLHILIQSRDNKELILFRNTSRIIFQMYYFYIFSINLFINCVSKPILCFSSCCTSQLFQAELSPNILY